MKKLSALRPSPALIVAFIALFVALSGTGYAVKRASIGSKQLKTNAVTPAKIRKNAVTTTKIKDNNVTGAKLLESSLGKVPDADKLDGNDAVAFEKSSKFTRVASFSLGNNESKEIYSLGPLKLTAKCSINDVGIDYSRILVSTTQDNSAFDGSESGVLNVATPEGVREFVQVIPPPATGTPGISTNPAAAVAPDGSQFVSGLWAGVNILGQPGRCSFGGMIEQVS